MKAKAERRIRQLESHKTFFSYIAAACFGGVLTTTNRTENAGEENPITIVLLLLLLLFAWWAYKVSTNIESINRELNKENNDNILLEYLIKIKVYMILP